MGKKLTLSEAIKPHLSQMSPEAKLQHLPSKVKYKVDRLNTKIETGLRSIKLDSFELGKNLSGVKKLLPHGCFQVWLEQYYKSELPYSTAYNYMHIYENFKDRPKMVQYLPMHFLMDMSRKTFPEELVKLIDEHKEYIDNDKIRHLKSFHQLFKSGDIDLNEFKKATKEQIELGINIFKGSTEQRLSRNFRKTLSHGTQDIIKAIRKVREETRKYRFHFAPSEHDTDMDLLCKDIDDTIKELQGLKTDLRGGDGFFETIIHQNPLIGKETKLRNTAS